MRGPFGYAIRHFSILLRNHKTLDVMLSRIPLPLLEGRILGQAFLCYHSESCQAARTFRDRNVQRPTPNVQLPKSERRRSSAGVLVS